MTKRYGTYEMRKRLVVKNVGKLMDGFVVHAEISCMYLVGFGLHMVCKMEWEIVQ